MLGRPGLGHSPSFNADSLGHSALRTITNLCFALFVLAVLVFTLIAATYRPADPLLHPSSSRLTSFLTSTLPNSTFRSDDSVLRTGEDFLQPNSTDSPSILLSDVSSDPSSTPESTELECDPSSPIDCTDPDTFHIMMRAAIEHFPDIHFYRFGKAVRGAPSDPASCDMAWRFRPKDAKRAAFYKDYRRFILSRSADNCTITVVSIGEYHSGPNARKRKKKSSSSKKDDLEFKKKSPKISSEVTGADTGTSTSTSPEVVPVVGEAVNDSLPVVESEGSFHAGRYLIYTGGGDRCKSMNHYLWSLLCALGEAKYLNRTLVMDLSICLSSIYTNTNQDEEGKDFRFYFDFEHLRDSASVLDQHEFWTDWGKWEKKDGLSLHVIEDFRVPPMKLAEFDDTLIMRKFGTVEPDNYGYRVCEGETESVIQRPWHLIWKSRRLMEIVSAVASKLNWDFDSVHIVRGEKAKNTELWPHLASDTSPEALLSTLREKVDDGRNLYIATNEPDTSIFDPLKDKYTTHFLDDYKELWGENSEWYIETKQLNNGIPVDFDGYMRVEVDTEVFLRGKKQIETFNDLTSDCKDGVNTCHATA